MITEEIGRKLNDLFLKYPVKLAYIFGSQVSGKTGTASDVDIAVLLDDKLSKEARFDTRLALIGAISNALGHQADVVVFNDTASLFFKYIIMKEGELIFEKSPSEAIDFEPRVLSLYFDFAPFLNLYNQAYVQRSV